MPFLGERHLAAALRQCGRRRSCPGADGMTWADYRRAAAIRIPRLARALREGAWRPGPLRINPLPTYSGKELPCVIPTVEDRLVHRAMRNAVEPVLEAGVFADWVSGYRPGRNRITALRQAMAWADQGFTSVADVDVAHVSHGSDPEQVTSWLAVHVHDGTFLDRFRTALAGLPSPLAPGTGVSPLLINLRLSRADRLLPDLRLVRFADNYCAFAASRTEAERAMERVLDRSVRTPVVPQGATVTDTAARLTPFAKLPRAAALDDRLSYRARGLLAERWCDRPGWTFTIEHLARTRGPGVEGHTVAELRAAGYVHLTGVPGRGDRLRSAFTLHRAAIPGGAGNAEPWVWAPYATARDGRLSYRARGLLLAQLSYAEPGTHEVALVGGVAALAEHHQAPGEGREALGTALGELLAAGYGSRERMRGLDGRIGWGRSFAEFRPESR
ncbi:hypothetical protein [Planotetraspora sp. GP83]|uniref:hypothetical protein n=1 Tax=Planotetraspora sp. GP83 TaxID=3156264 RepID=UPI003517CB79